MCKSRSQDSKSLVQQAFNSISSSKWDPCPPAHILTALHRGPAYSYFKYVQSNLNKHWSFISADINAFVALKINQHLTIQVHYIILHYITSHHVPFDSIPLHYTTHVHVIIHHAYSLSLSGYVALPGETWPISTTVCSKRAKEQQKSKRKVLRTNYKFSLQIYCPSPQCLVCKSLKLCNAVHIIVDTRCWAKWNCVYRISSIL